MQDLKNNYEFNRALNKKGYSGKGTFGTASFSFKKVDQITSSEEGEIVEYDVIYKVYVNNQFFGFIKVSYFENSYGDTREYGWHQWVDGKEKTVTVWE